MSAVPGACTASPRAVRLPVGQPSSREPPPCQLCRHDQAPFLVDAALRAVGMTASNAIPLATPSNNAGCQPKAGAVSCLHGCTPSCVGQSYVAPPGEHKGVRLRA